MYKNVLRQIFLRDGDNGLVPFDPEVLRTRIAAAFESAELAEESFVADDIVLALEYTLRRAVRTELIFSAGEIDAAIIRILENAGFASAAEVFRNTATIEQQVELSTSAETLQVFLSSHLGCSPERLEKISKKCADALNTLQIETASLHLILELARHYERETAEADLRNHPVPEIKNSVLTRQEIAELLPAPAAELLKYGVLRINSVSPIFPGIRFFFSMEKFAELHNLSIPATELEIYPALYETAGILESARAAIERKLDLPETPPCLMTIPDMFDFLHRMMGCSKADTMAVELASILTSGFKSELYQLSFD